MARIIPMDFETLQRGHVPLDYVRHNDAFAVNSLKDAQALGGAATDILNPLIGAVSNASFNKDAAQQLLQEGENAQVAADAAPAVAGGAADIAAAQQEHQKIMGDLPGEALQSDVASSYIPKQAGQTQRSGMGGAAQSLMQNDGAPQQRYGQTLPAQDVNGSHFPEQFVPTRAPQPFAGAADRSSAGGIENRQQFPVAPAQQQAPEPQQAQQAPVDPRPAATDGQVAESTAKAPSVGTGHSTGRMAPAAPSDLPASYGDMERLALKAHQTGDIALGQKVLRAFDTLEGADVPPDTWQDALTGAHKVRAREKLMHILQPPNSKSPQAVDEEMRQAKLARIRELTLDQQADNGSERQREDNRSKGIGGDAKSKVERGNNAGVREAGLAQKAQGQGMTAAAEGMHAEEMQVQKVAEKTGKAGIATADASTRDKKNKAGIAHTQAGTGLAIAQTKDIAPRAVDRRSNATANTSKAKSYDYWVHHPPQTESDSRKAGTAWQNDMDKLLLEKRTAEGDKAGAETEQTTTAVPANKPLHYQEKGAANKELAVTSEKAAAKQKEAATRLEKVDAAIKALEARKPAKGTFSSESHSKTGPAPTGEDLNKD